MSGGYFDYNEHKIIYVIEKLERAIKDNEGKYLNETIEKFKEGLHFLNLAYIFAHRIDCLLECDDGEDDFHKRLNEDLLKYYEGAQ